MKQQAPFIGVAGNIGVGKTTFTEVIAQRMGWESYYESVVDNPYLDDFYKDMSRWSFHLQIYFLHHRFRNHLEMSKSTHGVIQDRTIYEDVEIFARNLTDMNFMSGRDWDTYSNLFANMTTFLRKPDLIIYLKASIDTLLIRIKGRNREFEKSIDPEYLLRLNLLYDQWIKRITDIPLLIVDSDNFNIFQDKEYLDQIIEQMGEKLQ